MDPASLDSDAVIVVCRGHANGPGWRRLVGRGKSAGDVENGKSIGSLAELQLRAGGGDDLALIAGDDSHVEPFKG